MDEKKTMEQKWEDFKSECKWRWKETKQWCKDNKDAVVGVTVIVVPAAAKIIRSMVTDHKRKDDERHRNRCVYDPVHHHSYECKRDLKAYEWREIDRRKDAGESVYNILSSMDLI